MSAVVPQNSVLLDLNSRYAEQDPLYLNGRYRCSLVNANKVNSCIKILPHRITVPNIFPNIPVGSQIRVTAQSEDPAIDTSTLFVLDIPSKFYTRDEFIALFPPTAPLSFDETTQRFTITMPTDYIAIGTETITITASNKKVLELMGFTQTSDAEGLVVRTSLTYSGNYIWGTGPAGGYTAHIVPAGRYTASELGVNISALTQNVPGVGHTVGLPPPPAEQKFNFAAVNGGTFYLRNGDDFPIGPINRLAGALGITTSTPLTGPGISTFVVADEEPTLTTYQLTGESPPNFSGENFVHVALRELAQGNMVTSTSFEYNVLTTVPLDNTAYGNYKVQAASDLFTDDVDFPRQLTAATVEVAILDAEYQPLVIPKNYHVNVQLKAYHTDTAFRYN